MAVFRCGRLRSVCRPHTPLRIPARLPEPRRPCRLLASFHTWILLVFLAGIVASSVGQFKSHGLAAFGAIQPGIVCCSDAGRGHAHDEDEVAAPDEPVGHAHHSDDHSHDRAHALPADLLLDVLDPSRWRATVVHWTARLTAYRLERPPMA
jgi:hypothetical protein